MVFLLPASPFLMNIFSFENCFICLITKWMTHTNNKLSNWAFAYAEKQWKWLKKPCSKVLKINLLMKEVSLNFFQKLKLESTKYQDIKSPSLHTAFHKTRSLSVDPNVHILFLSVKHMTEADKTKVKKCVHSNNFCTGFIAQVYGCAVKYMQPEVHPSRSLYIMPLLSQACWNY